MIESKWLDMIRHYWPPIASPIAGCSSSPAFHVQFTSLGILRVSIAFFWEHRLVYIGHHFWDDRLSLAFAGCVYCSLALSLRSLKATSRFGNRDGIHEGMCRFAAPCQQFNNRINIFHKSNLKIRIFAGPRRGKSFTNLKPAFLYYTTR